MNKDLTPDEFVQNLFFKGLKAKRLGFLDAQISANRAIKAETKCAELANILLSIQSQDCWKFWEPNEPCQHCIIEEALADLPPQVLRLMEKTDG